MNDHNTTFGIFMHVVIVWMLNFIAFVVQVMPLLQALVICFTLIYTVIQIRIAWHNWKRRDQG